MLLRIVLQEMEIVQVRSLLVGGSGCEALPPEEEPPVEEPPEELLPPAAEPPPDELPLEELPLEESLPDVVLLSSCWVSSWVLFPLLETSLPAVSLSGFSLPVSPVLVLSLPVSSVFVLSCLFAACFCSSACWTVGESLSGWLSVLL